MQQLDLQEERIRLIGLLKRSILYSSFPILDEFSLYSTYRLTKESREWFTRMVNGSSRKHRS